MALERRLKVAKDDSVKLEVANKLADLYEGPLDDPKDAVRALDVVRSLDPEDFGAIQRLAELCERIEDWPRVAEHLAQLMEMEGDEEEVSRMTRRRAEILHQKVGKGDEALAALLEIADRGDVPCREESTCGLGDEPRLEGRRGRRQARRVEFCRHRRVWRARKLLRGAFDRFLGGRTQDGRGRRWQGSRARQGHRRRSSPNASNGSPSSWTDLDVLAVAHDLLVQDLSGPTRAEEFVRQAEVLVEAGLEGEAAIQHGEQASSLASPRATSSHWLARASPGSAPTSRASSRFYERQVTRCKNRADRSAAPSRARRALPRSRASSSALVASSTSCSAGGATEDAVESLSFEAAARAGDTDKGGDQLRRILAESLSTGGQGARDGGRTRSSMLARAARLAFEDLGDREQAFTWIGDAIIAHVGDECLDQLELFANEVGDPKRAEGVLSRALEEVFDGPLVRKLLARRSSIRRDKLADPQGAAVDLRRLHDLSPSDADVVEQLLALYTELADWRGMVQLYEDQILRGKDPAVRAELARKVARLWEEKLDDPRESADAWRRVLRMKQADPEATEGLERAKSGMLKRPKDEPFAASSEAASPAPLVQPEAPKAEAKPPAAETKPETELKETGGGGKKKKKRESKGPGPKAPEGQKATRLRTTTHGPAADALVGAAPSC